MDLERYNKKKSLKILLKNMLFFHDYCKECKEEREKRKKEK